MDEVKQVERGRPATRAPTVAPPSLARRPGHGKAHPSLPPPSLSSLSVQDKPSSSAQSARSPKKTKLKGGLLPPAPWTGPGSPPGKSKDDPAFKVPFPVASRSQTSPLKSKEPSTSGVSSPAATTNDAQSKQTRDAVRGIFDDYVTRGRYSKYIPTGGKKRRACGGLERVTVVKRIEQAIRDNVNEIMTFEFFNFHHPLSPNGADMVDVEVTIAAFDEAGLILTKSLFHSQLTCKTNYQLDQNVVYFFVPAEVENKAKSIYILVKVNSDGILNEGDPKKVRSSVQAGSRRQSLAAGGIPVKQLYYGVRCIASRSSGGELMTNHINSAVPLICVGDDMEDELPFKLSTEQWMRSPRDVAEIVTLTQHKMKTFPMTCVNFELTDQHCEEDWDEIDEEMKAKEKKLTGVAGAELVNFVFHRYLMSQGTPEKENASPKKKRNEVCDPASLLLSLPAIRCPFTLVDYGSLDQLVDNLNTEYPQLVFSRQGERCVAVSPGTPVPSREGSVVSSSSTAGRSKLRATKTSKKEKQRRKGRMLSYEETPIVVPLAVPDKFQPNNVNSQHNCDWMETYSKRLVNEYVDATDKEKLFMNTFNEFMTTQIKYPRVGNEQKVRALEDFVRAKAGFLRDNGILTHLEVHMVCLVKHGIMTPDQVAKVAHMIYD